VKIILKKEPNQDIFVLFVEKILLEKVLLEKKGNGIVRIVIRR